MDYLEEKELLKKTYTEERWDILRKEWVKYFGIDPSNTRKLDEYIEEKFDRRYHDKYQTNYHF